MTKKTALVLGAGGFIGNHMVNRLKSEGYWVRGVDLKHPEFGKSEADHFVIRDLRDPINAQELIGWAGSNRGPHQTWARQFDLPFDEIYQFAADMGGAGYIFTGNNDANVMHGSAMINLNVAHECVKKKVKKVFYSSSACMYPEHNQLNPDNPNCEESSAYPANPDSEYGWEKLFSERLFLSFNRNYELDENGERIIIWTTRDKWILGFIIFLGVICQPAYLLIYLLYALIECYRRFNCWFYYID